MTVSSSTFQFAFAFSLFFFGLTFIGAGFWKLMAFGLVAQAKALATQSVRISQKSLSDDITRVTQAAAQLTDAVNNLLRTSAGVGAFLILTGIVFLVSSYLVQFVLPGRLF